ncbi:MAG: hypothetical protein AABZ74_02655 [Cyanobacteriota bacterium]
MKNSFKLNNYINKKIFLVFFTIIIVFFINNNAYAEKGNILIIVSSKDKVILKNKKTKQAGLYLNQISLISEYIKKANFKATIASPEGNNIKIDPISNNIKFFSNTSQYNNSKIFFDKYLKDKKTIKIKNIMNSLNDYSGLIILGGSNAIEDLPTNNDLGTVINFFYESKKPIGAVAEGVIGLVSSMKKAENFINSVKKDNINFAINYSSGWIFTSYNMTLPSEEETLASMKDTPYIPYKALKYTRVFLSTNKYNPYVVIDKNLITAQNNKSIDKFNSYFMSKLK